MFWPWKAYRLLYITEENQGKKISSRSLEAKTETDLEQGYWVACFPSLALVSFLYTAQVYVPRNGILQCGQSLNDPPTCRHVSLMEAFLFPSVTRWHPALAITVPTLPITLLLSLYLYIFQPSTVLRKTECSLMTTLLFWKLSSIALEEIFYSHIPKQQDDSPSPSPGQAHV